MKYLLYMLAGAAEVHGFWRMRCGTIQTGRVDPVVSFGQVSSHVHMISGASNINTSSTYDGLRQSFCTSCEIQEDKSAYWTPLLYYQRGDGSFVPVRNDGTVVYYLGRGDDRANIIPFPPGLRMLSGDSSVRSYDNTTMTYGTSRSSGRPVADRVSFNCLQDGYAPLPETPGMIRTNCPYGLRAQIQFQSCWDGVNLYKSDQSHVAYLSQIDNGICPPTHPKLLPHLFYEIYYYPNEIDTSDGGHFVFANGDLTGYGFHGDFLNGWNMDVLQAGISQCINSVESGSISDCPPLQASDDGYFGQNCPEQPPIVNEQVKGVLSALPGCNTPSEGPGRASTTCSQAKPALNNVTNIDGGVREIPTTNTTRDGMTYSGCYIDNTSGRALNSASYASTDMSLETCASYCRAKGFPLFGTEYARECYCGNSISTARTNQSDCAMACSGNLTEYCGGSNRLSVWTLNTKSDTSATVSPSMSASASKAATTVFGSSTSTAASAASNPSASSTAKTPSTPSPSVSDASYLGCYSDGPSSRSLVGGYSGDNNMTVELCRTLAQDQNYKYFGLEYAGECFAGNFISSSQITASSCNMPCKGNSAEVCGGSNAMSMFQNSKYVQTANGPVVVANVTYTYQGCYIEGSSGRALGGSSSYAFTDSAMTVDKCASACYNKGFSYAGTEYATECYCNNVGIMNGGAPAANGDTDCNMTCSGNRTQFCGGSSRISTFRMFTGSRIMRQ